MRLIFIRHGDPDYSVDGLTEKGKREVALLAARVKNWQVDDVYISPLGRARATAEPCLRVWNKTGTVIEWAHEFFVNVDDGRGGKRIPWDYLPSEWAYINENFREQEWVNTPVMEPAKAEYYRVTAALDRLLKGYGYERSKRIYRVKEHSDKTVVFFCHFGISMVFLSHLINIPTQALFQGMYLPPTSITVLNSEERSPWEAYFRAERVGDCAHLIEGGEPISASGYFTTLFQEKPWKEE